MNMSSDNESGLEVVKRKTDINEEGNEKPKRPLSAYNFFLKEERKKILKNMVTDSTSAKTSVDDQNMLLDRSRRPMKKRRLVEPTNKFGTKEVVNEKGEISFERIGKLIGERWQEVKAKPELFTKYEQLASNDHKRYTSEMKSYNDRKKDMLLSVMESNSSPPKIETQLPSNIERPSSANSDKSGSVKISRVTSSQEEHAIDQDIEHIRGPSANAVSQDLYRSELEQKLSAATASPAALINLQSLLGAKHPQQQAVPLEYFTGAAQNQIPVAPSAAALAQLGMYNVGLSQAAPDNNAYNLALLRQQEEMAMLRQETLHREFMQMEQTKAYLANSQGMQGLQGLPHQAQLAASYASPNLEALLAQQSAAGLQLATLQQSPQQAQLAASYASPHLEALLAQQSAAGLQLAALQQSPQQAQLAASYASPHLEALLAQQSAAGLQLSALQQSPQQAQLVSLLSSQLQNPASHRSDADNDASSFPQLQLNSHEGGARAREVSHEEAAALLMAYSDMMRRRQV